MLSDDFSGNAAAELFQPDERSATDVPGLIPGCLACVAAALNPYCGLAVAGCPACHVRRLSDLPGHVRERHYESIACVTERSRLMVAVGAEYKRRKRLAQHLSGLSASSRSLSSPEVDR